MLEVRSGSRFYLAASNHDLIFQHLGVVGCKRISRSDFGNDVRLDQPQAAPATPSRQAIASTG